MPHSSAPDGHRLTISQTSPGSLVLIGGGCTAQGEALAAFIRLCGADKEGGGMIVGLTSASMDPVGSAMAWRETFAVAGARKTEFPIVNRRTRAQDRLVADMILDAPGIFLGGGDQVRLVSILAGSRVGEAIARAHENGAVVCGTSAGAAALTEVILAGGEPDEHGQHVNMYIGPGLGLLGFHAMIDTHFAQRRRLHRLFVAISTRPTFMGLGLDEDTALVVQGHLGAVVGQGGVTFVDGRSIRFDNEEDVARGAHLTLSHLRVGLIGNGYVFNLRERDLDILVQEEATQEEIPTVR